MPPLPPHRILVTWISDNFRVSGLVRPVIEELGAQRCLAICGSPDVVSKVPGGVPAVSLNQAIPFDSAAWRAEYRKCRGAWQRSLRELCRKHRLPHGAFGRLAFHLMTASQYVAGWLELLRAARPSAILTEYDRNDMWSCLVLAARTLRIPTFTLVHGVVNEEAVGYVPVLADKVFCWGEMQRRQFIAAGEKRAEVLIGGCPRLTRELGVTQAEARAKLGLAVDRPVLMLGTTSVNSRGRRELAELFCVAAGKLDGVSAIVRLHPSEQLDIYAAVASRHPHVRFMLNHEATLDEALAAADIVVVPNSGLGGDAVVKRRLVIVVDLPSLRLGHGGDLIERAGCPRATSAEELATAVQCLLGSEAERQGHFAAAERFVADFCAFYGRDSARRIAAIVGESLTPSQPVANSMQKAGV